jgi:hypothetical protein
MTRVGVRGSQWQALADADVMLFFSWLRLPIAAEIGAPMLSQSRIRSGYSPDTIKVPSAMDHRSRLSPASPFSSFRAFWRLVARGMGIGPNNCLRGKPFA